MAFCTLAAGPLTEVGFCAKTFTQLARVAGVHRDITVRADENGSSRDLGKSQGAVSVKTKELWKG
jgi:hypothetical protein